MSEQKTANGMQRVCMMIIGTSIWTGTTAAEGYDCLRAKHWHGKRPMTAEAMERCLAAGDRPHLYEVADETDRGKAYWVMVAVLRWAADNGYTPLAAGAIMKDVMNCDADSNKYYEAIATLDLAALLDGKPDLYADYCPLADRRAKAAVCTTGGMHHLGIQLPDALYLAIAAGAEKEKISMAQYVRNCVAGAVSGSVDLTPLLPLPTLVAEYSEAVHRLTNVCNMRGLADADTVRLEAICARADRCAARMQGEIRRLCRCISNQQGRGR